MVWLKPNFLLLSYYIPWKKGTMKGSSFGHSKQRRRPVYEGSHSALIFSNEGTSLIWVQSPTRGPAHGQQTHQYRMSLLRLLLDLNFYWRFGQSAEQCLPVGDAFALFPQMPHYSDTMTDLYACTSGFEDWAISRGGGSAFDQIII